MRASAAPGGAPTPAAIGPDDTVLLIGVTGITGRCAAREALAGSGLHTERRGRRAARR